MSRLLKDPLPPRVVDVQGRASHPLVSAWVTANAGAGKTHVLTQRVLRLLLSGAAPEAILCLTYTKAAAAEMRGRVASRLADWAVWPKAKLIETLTELEGNPPSPELVVKARQLFARALETPGGLKIQTIHAFAESVLHRFPLEAGVPVDFAVIEEGEQASMVSAVRERVLAGGLAGTGPEADAVEVLFGLMSDHAIGEGIGAALADMRSLRPVLADVPAAKERLRRSLGLSQLGRLEVDLVAGTLLTPEVCNEIVGRLGPTSKFGTHLSSKPSLDRTLLLDLLLTGRMEPRKSVLSAGEGRTHPDLVELLDRECARVVAAITAEVAIRIVQRSEALLDTLAAIVRQYRDRKRMRSLLDFDDLIAGIVRLLGDPTLGPWVRYKLDAGLAHILVDESQDTNAEQWQVVRLLTDDFFSGAGGERRLRTVFAVGDQKQSIFSFQGADPLLFPEEGEHYRRLALDAGQAFERLDLNFSFRTTQPVLDAVDRLRGRFGRGHLLHPEKGTLHEAVRAHQAGSVTLWPPIRVSQPDEADEATPFALPITDFRSAHRQVAERIASEIRAWIDARRPLGQRGRSVVEDDVLILVQSRGALFEEIIRALGKFRLRSPGADRLKVTSHIAVLDLLALGDVLANPAEDLQLASLLRSPLFDVSEDDLFAIAHGRAGTLFAALATSSLPAARIAYRQLADWQAKLDRERPFEFFAGVLYAGGGLRRFHARLGPEVDDVLSEFLELALQHEGSHQPSLQGFVAELRGRSVDIKRELAESGGGVRVMTVHGAKGLEAPIVILADAATKPHSSHLRSDVYFPTASGPYFVCPGSEKPRPPAIDAIFLAGAERVEEEYWRKLYVGMTRAEDELYLTGVLTKKGNLDGSWYEAVGEALRDEAEEQEEIVEGERGLIFPRGRIIAAELDTDTIQILPLAEPLRVAPLPAPQSIPVLHPSSAYVPLLDPDKLLQSGAEGALGADAARREGLALHALLQHLGRIAPQDRDRVLAEALAVLLADTPDRHAALAAKAQSILSRPDLAFLFGPDSRAEVPFAADMLRDGQPIRLVGRIDRLVVTDSEVLVVDFKSDANPPVAVENVPPGYVTQLGLYALAARQLFECRAVRTAILWTALESLMFLPDVVTSASVTSFTMR